MTYISFAALGTLSDEALRLLADELLIELACAGKALPECHATQVTAWKTQALENLAGIFGATAMADDGIRRPKPEPQPPSFVPLVAGN